MIPNPKWYPTSLQERAAWNQNFATQFVVVGTQLGFTALDQSSVVADNDMIQFLANTAVEVEAFKDAARQFRVIITEGNIGEPMPAFPADPTFTVPASVPTGIFERLDNLVKRIRVSPTYTDEIGALLGIIPSNPAPLPIADLKPAIKASGSFSGYQFTMNVSRLGMERSRYRCRKRRRVRGQTSPLRPITPSMLPSTPALPANRNASSSALSSCKRTNPSASLATLPTSPSIPDTSRRRSYLFLLVPVLLASRSISLIR